MGHEIIVYEGRHVILNDMDLWTLRHFLLAEAEDRGLDELAAVLRSWEWIGPGVILNIDCLESFLVQAEGHRRDFLQLLEGTAARIQAFGNEIPLGYLQTHINTKMYCYTSGAPVSVWVAMIARLHNLVSGSASPLE